MKEKHQVLHFKTFSTNLDLTESIGLFHVIKISIIKMSGVNAGQGKREAANMSTLLVVVALRRCKSRSSL